MRLPSSPPPLTELISKHLRDAPDFMLDLSWNHNDPTPGGRYRHWHKLQFLQPPSGLTHETWWLAIKLARSTNLKNWPLNDRDGRPFRVANPDILLEMIHEIDRRASGMIQVQEVLPGEGDRKKFLLQSLSEEAIQSSQLEGAATTRKVAKKMLRDGRSPRDKSEQMILNNYHGMRFIAERAKDQPLTPDLIFELHGILTDKTLDEPRSVGAFRNEADDIAVVDESGQTLHLPPPASELPARLEAMCRFANGESGSGFIHPVVRSILLHFWLAYDHPFVDGNGRTARALFYWSMAKQGYWLIEFTSISRLFVRSRSNYNRAFLYSESDDNDATYFVLHQCRTILDAIDEMYRYLARKMADVKRSHELLRNSGALDLGLNHRQLALIRYAVDHPAVQYTVRAHRNYHNISYQTARTDLLKLSEIGMLLKTKLGREFLFLAPEDLSNRLQRFQEG